MAARRSSKVCLSSRNGEAWDIYILVNKLGLKVIEKALNRSWLDDKVMEAKSDQILSEVRKALNFLEVHKSSNLKGVGITAKTR